MIYTLDENLRTKYRSPSATAITGRTDEETRNWFSMDLIHPDDVATMREVIKEIFAQPDKPTPINVRTLHIDNHYIWLEGTITNKLDDPSIKAIIINLQDATERKNFEQKLIETQANLNTILDNTHSGYILMDTELRIITSNKVANDFAYENLHAESKQGDYFLSYVPDERKAVLAEFLYQALKGEYIKYIISYPNENQELRHYSFRIFPVYVEGKIKAVMMALTDITDRRKAEETILKSKANLTAIIENNGAYIYSIDTDYNFIMLNQKLKTGLKEVYGVDIHPGHNILEIFKELNPYEETIWKNLYDKALTGVAVNEVVEIIVKEQAIYNSISFNPIIENNKVTGLSCFLVDVTQEKITEQQVIEARANLKAIIENYDAYIYSIDREMKYISMNQKHSKWLKEIYGIDFKNGDKIIDFLRADNEYVYNQWNAIYKNAFEGEKMEFVREQIMHDGLHYLKYSINPIVENGRINALSCIAIDITEQKKADEVILKTKANLNAIIENYDACIYSVDRDLRYIALNQKQKTRMFEIYGLHFKEGDPVIDFINKNGLENYKEERSRYLRALSGEKIDVVLEQKINNETHYIRFSANPIIENGIITSLSCFSIDITEQRRNEMQLRLNFKAVENADEGIIITDWSLPRNPIIYANKGFERITGYNTADILGQNCGFLRGENTNKDTIQKIKDCINNHEAFEGEILNYRKDGTPFWNFLRINPIYDANNQLTHFVGFQNDITERKKIEQEIRDTNDSLRYLSSHLENIREEERSEISREIHDELGQELTGLKMSLESIKKKTAHDLDLFYQSVDAIELVNTTINTVRRIATELRPGILDDLGLEAAVEWHTKEFEKKSGIPCKLSTENLSEHYTKQQSISVFRIFQESMTNIGRHAKASEVKIHLYEQNKKLFLTVDDNGVGFKLKLDKLRSLGIIGMRERARIIQANFDIGKSDLGGTKVSLEVPLL
jgi:PAS domain S-box-containing protein